MILTSIFLVTVAYLLGSVCSAIVVCKLFNLPDPRTEGSQNPGATNVLRLAGKQYAVYVLVGDMLKGTLPVVLAQALNAPPAVCSLAVLAAVVGHIYPVFFRFKGGKGVATAIGALFGLQLFVGLLTAATWVLVAKFSKYSSLASLIAITLAPLYALLIVPQVTIFPPLFLMTILIIYKHRNNITRLMDGTEPKILLKNTVIEEIVEETPENYHSDGHETDSLPLTEPLVKKPVVKKTQAPKKKKPVSKANPAKKTEKTEKIKPLEQATAVKTTKKAASKKPKPKTGEAKVVTKKTVTKSSPKKAEVSKAPQTEKPKAKGKPKATKVDTPQKS